VICGRRFASRLGDAGCSGRRSYRRSQNVLEARNPGAFLGRRHGSAGRLYAVVGDSVIACIRDSRPSRERRSTRRNGFGPAGARRAYDVPSGSLFKCVVSSTPDKAIPATDRDADSFQHSRAFEGITAPSPRHNSQIHDAPRTMPRCSLPSPMRAATHRPRYFLIAAGLIRGRWRVVRRYPRAKARRYESQHPPQ